MNKYFLIRVINIPQYIRNIFLLNKYSWLCRYGNMINNIRVATLKTSHKTVKAKL